jgi:hypothetical protein
VKNDEVPDKYEPWSKERLKRLSDRMMEKYPDRDKESEKNRVARAEAYERWRESLKDPKA